MVPSVVVNPSCARILRERGPKRAQRRNLHHARQRSANRGADGPLRLKGMTHRANPRGAGSAQHGTKRGGEHMRVLVRVDVRQTHSALLQMRDLRRGFSLDLLRADAARKKPQQKTP